jgi:hypothetical protein
MEVTKVEQRSYVKIAVLRGRNARECHAELQEALGDRALPYRTVARWVEAFKRLPHRWQQTMDNLGDYFEGF